MINDKSPPNMTFFIPKIGQIIPQELFTISINLLFLESGSITIYIARLVLCGCVDMFANVNFVENH